MGESAATRGPAKWGDAHVEGGAIVFSSKGIHQVWRSDVGDVAAREKASDSYRCDQTDVFGELSPCADSDTLLVLHGAGTWSYGADEGRWSVEQGRAYFRSNTASGGPPSWGTAIVHDESVSFHGALNDHTTLFVRV